ncbi:hypothetical protein CVT25_006089 [Psilocybe cyanescens]|uniref:F-box domain-containing protein n=1 Tax=Psilocybe cyanescens TaxID=93625 RepID=A0A409VUS9_PSICY|nr:hypothetical protein CVT25_006089 [Psilocybe cyanescens]
MESHTSMFEKKIPLVLPYDLEREIFELTARAFPGHALKLCTLSRYVQEWMEAIIYETVVLELPLITVQLFLKTFYSRPASFFAKNVKRIYVTSIIDFDEARQVLAACSGATTVICWADRLGSKENIFQAISPQHVERMSIKLCSFWGGLPRPHQFTGAVFPNLSHLEIVCPPSVLCPFPIEWEGLRELPGLTHLALGHLWHSVHLHLLPFFEKALAEYLNLKVLLLLSNDEDFVDALDKMNILRDTRVVVQEEFNSTTTLVEYWETIRQGGPDFWASADGVIMSPLGYRKVANIE